MKKTKIKNISHQLVLLILACVTGMMILAGYSMYMLHNTTNKIRVAESKARVNGDIYNDLIQGKDAVADVLPPPEYIIEPFLTACQISDASDKAEVEKYVSYMTQLRKEYLERHSYWQTNLAEGPLKKALTVEAHEPAVRFFDVFDQEFMPAINSGDKAKAKEILKNRLAEEYASQRKAVDKVVSLTTDNNQADEKKLQAVLAGCEKEVASAMRSAAEISVIGVGVILALVTAIGWAVSRRVTTSVKQVANELDSAAEQVVSAADQVASSSQSLAGGASQQAAAVEETSASLEEMSSMTRHNAENSQKANDLARQTRAAADKGVADMGAMSAAMSDIKTSSDDVAKIIKTIDEIAFQTNILALNAAVAAARAGEAGMGFAVVADEVRNLAQRSAQAAKETAGKIEGAIEKTAQGVQLSDRVSESLNEIVGKARLMDELATSVAGASSEQSQGIAQVNKAVGHMDKATQKNAATAEECAAAAEELHGQARSMEAAVADLMKMVGSAAVAANHDTFYSSSNTPKPSPVKPSAKPVGHIVSGNGRSNAPVDLAIPMPGEDCWKSNGNHSVNVSAPGDFRDV